jgi:hypothetical protein
MHGAPSLLWPLEAEPKAVGIDLERFRPAPHLRRGWAWIIDFALVLVIVWLLHRPFSYALPLALLAAYHGVSVSVTKTTFGKALMGLEVRRLGKRPGFVWSLSRSLVGYFGVDLLGLGLIPAFIDARHRALHDRLWKSEVVAVGDGRIDVKSLVERANRFLEYQAAALRRRKDALAGLGAMVAWLLGLARILEKVLDFVWAVGGGAGSPAGSQSIFDRLSVKARAVLATVATTASTAVVATVPPVDHGVKWVLEPRYYLGRPGPPHALVGTWRTRQLALRFNKNGVDKSPLPAETWEISAAGRGYRLSIGSTKIELSRVTENQYVGEGGTSKEDCVSFDTSRLIEKDGYLDRNFYQVILDASKPTFEREIYGRATKTAIKKNCRETTTAIYGATGTRTR